jgi:hypothetical protein
MERKERVVGKDTGPRVNERGNEKKTGRENGDKEMTRTNTHRALQ